MIALREQSTKGDRVKRILLRDSGREGYGEETCKGLAPSLTGVDLLLTDGDPPYNFTEHERCLFHRLRNICKRDPKPEGDEKESSPIGGDCPIPS